MRTFLRRWALAAAGFLCLELAIRPPRRDVLSDRAAEMLIDLADLDRELRGITDQHGHPVTAADIVAMGERNLQRRPLCLCSGCQRA